MKILTTMLDVATQEGLPETPGLITDRDEARVVADMAAQGWRLTAARSITRPVAAARLHFDRYVEAE